MIPVTYVQFLEDANKIIIYRIESNGCEFIEALHGYIPNQRAL